MVVHEIGKGTVRPPDDATELPPLESDSLRFIAMRRMISHCLEKEAERRYKSMSDLAFEFNGLVCQHDEHRSRIGEESLAYPPASEVEQLRGEQAALPGGRKKPFGAALLTAVLLASLVTWISIPKQAPQIVHSSILPPEGAALDSPDGRFLALMERSAGALPPGSRNASGRDLWGLAVELVPDLLHGVLRAPVLCLNVGETLEPPDRRVQIRAETDPYAPRRKS